MSINVIAERKHPRCVNADELNGCISFPIGLAFLDSITPRKKLVVSTVALDGVHLEDPLGWCEPETGFETMVFVDGCTFFSVFTQRYKNREDAAAGHADILARLTAGTLQLAAPVRYTLWEAA